jgi:flagellar assembly factor FliW
MTLSILADTDRDVSIVHSELLGDLRVRESDIFQFPNGLLGFPECRRFALLRGSSEGLFWLQSLEHGALVFLLVDPFAVVPHYAIDIAPSQLGELGIAEPSDVGTLAVVTLPPTNLEWPTVNLQGPLALNFKTRLGKQLVCGEGDYGVRCPVDIARLVA